MRRVAAIGLCVFGLWACGGSESSDSSGKGGASTGGKGGTSGKGGSSGTSGTGGTSAGGTGGTSAGGTGGTSVGGSAGVTSGGSAGVTSGGSAGVTSGGSAGTTSGGSAGTSSGGSAGATTDAGVPCGKKCTDAGFKCCGAACVNPNNDILNCGSCGTQCAGEHPTCNGGQCGKPPCESGTNCSSATFCCGSACCAAGELCCNVPGPLVTGPKCTAPLNGTCPMGCLQCKCLAPDTLIATPKGERKIKDIGVGDFVLSLDHGRVVAVRVAQINRTPVREHRILRVRLESGRVLEASPGHPTADGRRFAEIGVGSMLDGVRVEASELVAYGEPFTYDILPESDSGTYFVAGVLIGSTLKGETTNIPTAPFENLVCGR